MGRIAVVVSPGARRSELVGRRGDAWKVRVAAAPERGKANEAVSALVAAALDVPRGKVWVVVGGSARRKIVEVAGLTSEEIERRLAALTRPAD